MRLLQLSDTHFGTEQANVVAALTRFAIELKPDVLVLSGDITQRARPPQFAAARAFVDSLGIATRVSLPGNHDIPLFNPWLRVFRPYANYAREFGDDLEPSLRRDDLQLLTVKTTRRYRHKNGEVSARQIERVCEALQSSSRQQLRIVVVHQPMHVPRPQDEENLLRNAAEAAQRWAAAGADLVLGGHIHLPYVLPMSQRHPGLSRELWCVQAGTAVSSRVRWEAPNSVNLIDYPAQTKGEACTVSRWDYAASTDTFVRAADHPIALQR
jgi:3',5'-cyclic AMP phosphodiesterase CpdA